MPLPVGCGVKVVSVALTNAVYPAAALVACSRLTYTARDMSTRAGIVMALDISGQLTSPDWSIYLLFRDYYKHSVIGTQEPKS